MPSKAEEQQNAFAWFHENLPELVPVFKSILKNSKTKKPTK